MKKNSWIFGILFFALFVIIIGVICLQGHKVDLEFAKEVEVRFIYGDLNKIHCLGKEELEILKNIFNKKKLYKDNPSCGFSEEISIKFNKEQTFCIAQDTCPIIYWKEKNRYIKLSEKEKKQLYDLLEPYGFFFPCV